MKIPFIQRWVQRSPSKLLFIFFAVLIITLFAAGCGGSGGTADGTADGSAGGTVKDNITIAYGRDFYYGPEDVSFLHMSTNVWESLTALDEKLNVCPVLLEKWEMSENGKVWDLYLKKGIKFHDGSTLDASVVIYNIEHHLKKNPETQSLYANVESLKKLDASTVRVTLSKPEPLFPNMISSFSSPIFSKDSFNEDGTIKFPYGTGPYKLKDFKAGEYITVERFDDYWGDKGSVKTFTFKTVKDENARVAALQSGEIDVIADVGAILPEQAEALKAQKGINIYTQQVGTSHYMFFNVKKTPFDNQALRQALNMAINRQQLTDSVVAGYGIPGVSVITPLAAKWCCQDAAPAFNMQKAKDIAAQNPSEENVIILVHSGFASRWPYKAIGEIVLSALNDLGLKGEIKMYEGGAWMKEIKAGNYNISFHPYTLQTGEPDFYFSTWLHSAGPLNKSRNIGFADPEIDALIEEARQTCDESKKIELYNQLQLKANDLAVMVPLYHEVTIFAARDYVKDFTMNPQFKPDLARVRVK